jgi:sterol desaturase/sphingolipid hydroxylase (fatty acid hydroxylase superfamily)
VVESVTLPDDGPPGRVVDLLRRTLVVAVILVPLVAACWYVSDQRSLGQFSVGIYLAVAGLLVLCEHLLPFDRGWGSAVRGNRTDFTYVVLAAAMDKIVFVLSVTAIAAVGRTGAERVGADLWPSGHGLGVQVAVALLIADAATYLRHRLSHSLDVLWRFHRVHHSMTGMYWIRSAYTHPLEQLFILSAIMLPISLLGAGDEVVAVVALVFGLSGLLQHANIDARSSILNYVFATPEVHRVHHAIDHDDSNFSAFFVVMDLLCGTYRRPAAVGPVRVGLRDWAGFPDDFVSQLTVPFRRQPVGRDDGETGRGMTSRGRATADPAPPSDRPVVGGA